jgi:hypothetical protein
VRNPDRAGTLCSVLAVVIAAMIVAGCAATTPPAKGSSPATGSSFTPRGTTSSEAARAPSPATLERIPGALVSADGLHITSTGEGGGEIASLALSARETSTAVTLSLAATPATCPCAANATVEQVKAVLMKPLGTRHLIDAATGDTITVMSGTALVRVGWLPVGYTTDPVDILAATTAVDGEPIGWTRSYAALEPANTNVLTVTQYVGDHMADTDLVPASGQPVDINGSPGRASHGGGADQGYAFPVVQRQVAWQQDGYTFEVADELGRILPGQVVLSDADLLRIARSLAMPS